MSRKAKPKHLLQFFILGVSFVALVLGIYQFSNLKRWFVKASKINADLVVDYAGKTIPLDPIWQNLAQGGEDPAFNPSSLTTQLKPLKPQMIRLDHLYDFYITVGRDNNTLVYDYSKLDQIVKSIRSLGATPFISLSYMPSILNSDIVGAPSSYSDYRQIVQDTIQHLSGKNGLNIPNVYYEVWNEPDLFGQWKTYGEKNYLDLYKAVSQAAAATTNTQAFKIGGPGTTKLYKNWIMNLVNTSQEQGLRLDFISWHTIALSLTPTSKILTNLNHG